MSTEMNQHKRNLQLWNQRYADRWLSIWNDKTQTREERIAQLNRERIPTPRSTKHGWTLTNCYRMYHRLTD